MTEPPRKAIEWIADYRIGALIVILGVLVSYGTTLNGVFLWDDEYVVMKNLFIRDLSNIPLLLTGEYFEPAGIGHYTRAGEESYRPLVTLSHFLDYRFFELGPAGYHAVNLILHLLTCLALLHLFRAVGLPGAAALIGTMLFAVHPVNSETVNMVSYREDILAGLFFCLALAQFVKGRTLPAAVLYGLALLSKEMALSLLPMAILHTTLTGDASKRLLYRKGSRSFQGRLKKKIVPLSALFAVTALYLSVVILACPPRSVQDADYPGGSLLTGVMTSARVVARYMRLFFLPFDLRIDYAFPASSSPWDPLAFLSMVLIVGAICLPLARRFEVKATFLILWFFVALVPVSGLIPIRNVIAERYLYIPVMGWCGAVGAGIHVLLGYGKRVRKVTLPCLVAVGVAFATYNIKRNRLWSDEILFFREMTRATPSGYKGYTGLGLALYRTGNLVGAEEALAQSIELNDTQTIALHNYGCVILKLGRTAQAEEAFARVLERNPGFTESRYQLGMLLKGRGEIERAERELRGALESNPNFIPAKFMLGVILQDRGVFNEAIGLYEDCVSLDPRYAKALKNLGIIYYYRLDDPVMAAPYFRRYLGLVPEDPQRELIERAIESKGKP